MQVEREDWVTRESWPTGIVMILLEDSFVQDAGSEAFCDYSQLILKHFLSFHVLTSPKFMAYQFNWQLFFFFSGW